MNQMTSDKELEKEIEKPLMKPKLIWKGTTKEGIELGKFTQEEVDRWNMDDEEGERYTDGFFAGRKEARTDILEKIEELYLRLHSNYEFMKDKSGEELFCIPKEHYERWIKPYLKEIQKIFAEELKQKIQGVGK